MKRLFQSVILPLIIAGLLFYACKKDRLCESCDKNQPPSAKAGNDSVITLPTDSILLDASASYDPDGNITTWEWKKIEGPASFAFVNTNSIKIQVNKLTKGIYQFELIVTDNGGLSAKDTVQITVNDLLQPNRPPVANAGTDQTITLPTNAVTLNGGASTDPDNNITNYAWAKISGPSSFNIMNANSIQTEVTNLTEGIYQFELKVTDAGGLIMRDTMNATVFSPPSVNRPPSAYSGNDFIIHLPKDTGYLYGYASDPDYNIAVIKWTKIAGPSSFNIVRPDSVFSRITNLERGVYKFEIKVVDSLGLTARDTNTVIVGELPANPQEIILTNQPWGCHWDCYIQIEQLYNKIPSDRIFKVFIKRDNSNTWHEVTQWEDITHQSSIYFYGLRKGTLWIYDSLYSDIYDAPDIKIVY